MPSSPSGRRLSDWGQSDDGTGIIFDAVLQMAAEIFPSDGFARARLSKREIDFRHGIEEWIVEHERRSREAGWSFTKNLLHKRLGPWPPVKLKVTKAARKPKAKRKKAVQPKDIKL